MTSRPWLTGYDPGVPVQLDYPAVPVFHFLDEAAQRCPERACILFQGRKLTYRQVAEMSGQAAAALTRLGVRKGDRVGIFLPNRPEFILAYFAILKAGGVVVATNPLYTPPEIVHQLNDAEPQLVITSDLLYARLKTAQPETRVRTVIACGEVDLQPGDLPFASLTKEPRSNLEAVGPDDVALFQYTGGTTGTARAAVARHRNLVANALQFKAWMSTLQEEQETFLLALPIYHIYGMVCGMLLGMAMRASLAIIPDPRDISDLLATIQTHGVSYFPAVPTLYSAINHHPDILAGRIDLTSIKACISGSAPLMKETKERFERLTGGRICEGYGLSEAPTATHCNPLQGENRLGSIGLPLPDVEARIVSPEAGLRQIPIGEAGELILRGPQVMQGYHNMPQETARALRSGWLYTGDIARMDAEGYFYIVDRKKDIIKPGGMTVWPREVEEALSTHPKVLEVSVAGIPDGYRGETVKAWVVARPGEPLDEAELLEWCRARLAPFKVPTQVAFRQQLPKSTVGKVLKRNLLEEEKTAKKVS
ncbi:MAG: long-chain fatty acid--CoA ligase [Anaerolineales bacterium]|nr:long-chain fatty acid--CoA ligase [Anaerolineales bacterium]